MTWITPEKAVAPYITGAGPRRISMRSTPSRSSEGVAGLNAPPQGMPSTTSRKASASRRPQSAGTEPAGPASPPGVPSTPATSDSAVRRSSAPRARSSSPVTMLIEAGTCPTGSGSRVAVTCTLSSGSSFAPWARARVRQACCAQHNQQDRKPCRLHFDHRTFSGPPAGTVLRITNCTIVCGRSAVRRSAAGVR